MAASRNGSLTLFNNGEAAKTVQLPGEKPLVRYMNGEIISAAEKGQLTVLNKKLEILRTFHGTRTTVRTLTSNTRFIVFGDYDGVVRYYNRTGGKFPRVSVFLGILKIIYRFIVMKKKSYRLTLTVK